MKAELVLEERSVDDPMMTTAQLVHERAKSGNRLVGRVQVTSNAMTRIGALCYVRRRLSHHEKAAERFKNLYESLYGSGMPAVDAGRIQVDSSIKTPDNGMPGRLDRGADLGIAKGLIGKSRFDLIVGVVVLGIPCIDYCPPQFGRRSWRERESVVDTLLDTLDELSGHWDFGRAA